MVLLSKKILEKLGPKVEDLGREILLPRFPPLYVFLSGRVDMSGCNTPISDKLMTQEEVDALPDESVVYIRWSGGNGPWMYTLKTVKYPAREKCFLFSARDAGQYQVAYTMRGDYVGRVDFVGDERCHTQVCFPDDLREGLIERTD